MYTALFCATACPCPRIDLDPACPQSKQEILQAYAVLFWFNFYLRCPDFPATEGMFPKAPEARGTYLRVHEKVFAHWATAANRIGIPTARFREACATVRAAWIGADDPLAACRSRAGALAGYPSMDLD
jgi:hypothetical protein